MMKRKSRSLLEQKQISTDKDVTIKYNHEPMMYTKSPYISRFIQVDRYYNRSYTRDHSITYYAQFNSQFYDQFIGELFSPTALNGISNLTELAFHYHYYPQCESETCFGTVIKRGREAEAEYYSYYFSDYRPNHTSKAYGLVNASLLQRIDYYPQHNLTLITFRPRYDIIAYVVYYDKKTNEKKIIHIANERSIKLLENVLEFHGTKEKVTKRLKTLALKAKDIDKKFEMEDKLYAAIRSNLDYIINNYNNYY